jgi:hypothetical protein
VVSRWRAQTFLINRLPASNVRVPLTQ